MDRGWIWSLWRYSIFKEEEWITNISHILKGKPSTDWETLEGTSCVLLVAPYLLFSSRCHKINSDSPSLPLCVLILAPHLLLGPVLVLYVFWLWGVGVSLASAESSLCVKEELFQSWQKHQHRKICCKLILQPCLCSSVRSENAYNNIGRLSQERA